MQKKFIFKAKNNITYLFTGVYVYLKKTKKLMNFIKEYAYLR